MKEFIVYSKDACMYCEKAKQLLKNKGRDFNEVKLGRDIDHSDLLETLQYYGHGRTMPCVVRTDDAGNVERIGGFDELVKFFEEEK